MDMSSMAGMATSTAPGMASATSHMDMDMDMDMDMGMGGSPSGMDMVFFDAIGTSLFSKAWTPTTTGQYAGTCIFLIAFTVIFRALLALRSCLESTTWANGTVDSHAMHSAYQRTHDGAAIEKTAMGGINSAWAERPHWQLRIDGWRALLETVLVGVGYLLMLAVMTMNVGYFASILAGTFLGSAALGRFTRGGSSC